MKHLVDDIPITYITTKLKYSPILKHTLSHKTTKQKRFKTTTKLGKKLRVTERAMERIMVGVTRKDIVRNTDTRENKS